MGVRYGLEGGMVESAKESKLQDLVYAIIEQPLNSKYRYDDYTLCLYPVFLLQPK